MVMMTLYVKQQKRHRCKEQTFGLWKKVRVGWFERTALNHVYYICEIDHQSRFYAWGRALRAGALGWPWGMGWGGRWEGFQDGEHMYVDVWQKPPQYCKVISLQLK